MAGQRILQAGLHRSHRSQVVDMAHSEEFFIYEDDEDEDSYEGDDDFALMEEF